MADLRAPSPRAQALLAAFREEERPDLEVARRSWRALRERVAHPQVAAREAWAQTLPPIEEPYGEDSWDEPELLATMAAQPGLWHYAKAVTTSVAIAAAVLLGARVVVTSATTMTQQARDTALAAPYQGSANATGGKAAVGQPEAAAVRPPKGPPTPAAAAPAAASDPEPAAVPVESVLPSFPAKPRKARPNRAKPAATQVDDIAAELALVKDATQARNRGDNAKATALLAEHAKRFPSGALSQEREVLRAEVLCAGGQRSKARGLAERFAQRHPKSALLGRMNGVCAD
ncbi:MAG: hypothetical protein AAF721_41230 [Myxococcota bacterium]